MVYQKKVPKWFRRMKIKSTFSFPAPVVVLVGPYTPNWWTGLSSGDSKDVFVFVSVTVDFTPCSWDRTHSGAAAWATDHFKWGNLRLVFKVNRFHDDQQPDSVTVRPRHDFVFVFSFRSEDTVASQTTSVFASWSEGDEGVQMVWLSVCDDIITPAAHRPRQASSVSQPSRLHSAPLSSLRGFHVDRPLTRLQLNEPSTAGEWRPFDEVKDQLENSSHGQR